MFVYLKPKLPLKNNVKNMKVKIDLVIVCNYNRFKLIKFIVKNNVNDLLFMLLLF